jgi:hypothetical protein
MKRFFPIPKSWTNANSNVLCLLLGRPPFQLLTKQEFESAFHLPPSTSCEVRGHLFSQESEACYQISQYSVGRFLRLLKNIKKTKPWGTEKTLGAWRLGVRVACCVLHEGAQTHSEE